ncbi:2-dehydropantoate 2-reductase [Baekduia soli]|uniref:2-dehydropantoate 2-reductase n=1 Tax=Baekduia soli TaxID=496014 RepID=A0A5B8U8D0_9ACTN|nr:2-dehydropantoate 2-reductase [Baekduia soli]QEC49205.1 2-dehydropantoate 2-reductase [Baekduia soli]
MRVAMVGAGAMGSVYGGFLALAGHEVTWVELWQEHVDAINADGLRMTCGDEERVARGRAIADAAQLGPVDLVMIWTKAYDTAQAMRDIAPVLGPDTAVCTLQNGLGNVEVIEEHVAPERVVYGVAAVGAVLAGPGHISVSDGAWGGESMTWVGTRHPDGRGIVERTAAMLTDATLPTEVRDDIDVLVWNKLAMAAAMSSVASTTRLRMGLVLDSPGTFALLRTLTEEIVAVAAAKGIPLDPEEALTRNLTAYEHGREHLPSMLQDVIARRRTEVSALTRAIADEGQALGVPTPALTTLAALIEAIEANYDGQRFPEPAVR